MVEYIVMTVWPDSPMKLDGIDGEGIIIELLNHAGTKERVKIMATQKQKDMINKLTKKQKGFVKDYIETGNGTEAVIRNYDVKDRIVAKSMGTENLTKPYINDAIAEALPDNLLTERHLELLNKREVYRLNKPGEPEEFELLDTPDTQAVSKGLDMAYKIKGSYSAEKHLNLNINAEELRLVIQDGLTKFRPNKGGEGVLS